MIHVFIGTKAQFIKVAPILKELDNRTISYRLIDSCQHSDITKDLRKIFSIKNPDAFLDEKFTNINSLPKAFLWVSKIIFRIIFLKNKLRNSLFGENPYGVCLIHGDTLSTLLGLIIAKSCGLKVAHLEAGLRSFDLFNPFPEEIIRIICMKFADYLFTPSQWAEDNLIKMNIRGEIFNVGENTIIDSMGLMLPQKKDFKFSDMKPYAIMSIHRFENIYSSKRLKLIINLALQISNKLNLFFIMHQPTQKKLERSGAINRIKKEKIYNYPLTSYDNFILILKNAEFIITDGGSIQEESYALDIPCLLMRKKTERQDGISENVCLSKFDSKIIDNFLKDYKSFRSLKSQNDESPSKKIVDIISGFPS